MRINRVKIANIYVLTMIIVISVFAIAPFASAHDGEDHSVTTATNFQVTTPGSSNWQSTIQVPNGSATSWMLSYQNNATTTIDKIVLKTKIPQMHTLVPGSVTLFDGNNPNGLVLSDSGLFSTGLDLGKVAPSGNGFVRFRTVVDSSAPCGTSTKNTATFITDGSKSTNSAVFRTQDCTTKSVTTTPTVAAQNTRTAIKLAHDGEDHSNDNPPAVPSPKPVETQTVPSNIQVQGVSTTVPNTGPGSITLTLLAVFVAGYLGRFLVYRIKSSK